MGSGAHFDFFPFNPAAVLTVSGSDAETFLQGQFSNDLRLLEKQPAVYGLWLNHKGKVVADSFIIRDAVDGSFVLMSYFSRAETILERLDPYVIADDVIIRNDTGAFTGVSILSELGPDMKDLPPSARAFPGRRKRGKNTDWIFPMEFAEATRTKLLAQGGQELSSAALARIRITSAIAAIPQDIGPSDLPNEGELDDEAVSYVKGCYLGQEVMARLKSMGKVRRRLLRVCGEAQVFPEHPAPLYVGDRLVGELRSAAAAESEGFVGLAMLSLLHLQGRPTVTFAPNSGARVHLMDAHE